MNTKPSTGWRVDVNAVDLVRIIVGRLDEDVPPALYRAISVEASDYRASLSALGLRHATDGGDVTIAELDRSADHATRVSVRTAGLVGGAGGLVGWLGVPPETAARVIQSARLAQRLAIIYGHDPLSDRGQAHIRKALAEAWGIALPRQMESDLRLSDLPTLLQRRPRAAARTAAATRTRAPAPAGRHSSGPTRTASRTPRPTRRCWSGSARSSTRRATMRGRG